MCRLVFVLALVLFSFPAFAQTTRVQGLPNGDPVIISGTSSVSIIKLGGTPTATAVVCGTTATTTPMVALAKRTSLCIQNSSGVPVYIGGSTVTTSTGILLNVADSFCDDVGLTAYYCIVASGTATVRVLEN